VVELPASKRKVEITIHGDDDFAWVYDKKRGRYLTEDEFEVEIRQPVNKLLPRSYHLQHGAQSTVDTYYLRKLNNDMDAVLKKTEGVGHVGPVVELSWNAKGELMTKTFSAEQARAKFMKQGWFWNPAWDATKSYAAEAGLGDLAVAGAKTVWNTGKMLNYLTPPMQMAPVRAANMYINAINEK
jgi:hypothetical protein